MKKLHINVLFLSCVVIKLITSFYLINIHMSILVCAEAQLSPATFDPRKVDTKVLEASFEYFILLSARDDENR